MELLPHKEFTLILIILTSKYALAVWESMNNGSLQSFTQKEVKPNDELASMHCHLPISLYEAQNNDAKGNKHNYPC